MLLNSTKVLYSVNRDIKNSYYFYGRKGLKPIRSNFELKLEREVMYVQKGGISIYDYNNYKNNNRPKQEYVGHIIIDDLSSFEINSPFDLNVCEKIIQNKLKYN